MQKQDQPVAFFDSGLGGISVLRETVRLLPQENYLYYGDSLHAPYGVKSEAQIQALSLAGGGASGKRRSQGHRRGLQHGDIRRHRPAAASLPRTFP